MIGFSQSKEKEDKCISNSSRSVILTQNCRLLPESFFFPALPDTSGFPDERRQLPTQVN